MDTTPRMIPGTEPTARTAAAVTGGRVVGVAGEPVTEAGADSATKPLVSHAAAAAAFFGVAARDKAVGEDVLVFRQAIIEIEVGATAVAAGDRVAVDTSGNGTVVAVGAATAAAGSNIGVATRAGAAGARAMVALD